MKFLAKRKRGRVLISADVAWPDGRRVLRPHITLENEAVVLLDIRLKDSLAQP